MTASAPLCRTSWTRWSCRDVPASRRRRSAWACAFAHGWRRVSCHRSGTDRHPSPIGTGSQALQHETDHLDGMLYLSRLSPDERKIAMRRIRESSWF
jgi:hypothetical protein